MVKCHLHQFNIGKAIEDQSWLQSRGECEICHEAVKIFITILNNLQTSMLIKHILSEH